MDPIVKGVVNRLYGDDATTPPPATERRSKALETALADKSERLNRALLTVDRLVSQMNQEQACYGKLLTSLEQAYYCCDDYELLEEAVKALIDENKA